MATAPDGRPMVHRAEPHREIIARARCARAPRYLAGSVTPRGFWSASRRAACEALGGALYFGWIDSRSDQLRGGFPLSSCRCASPADQRLVEERLGRIERLERTRLLDRGGRASSRPRSEGGAGPGSTAPSARATQPRPQPLSGRTPRRRANFGASPPRRRRVILTSIRTPQSAGKHQERHVAQTVRLAAQNIRAPTASGSHSHRPAAATSQRDVRESA